MRLRRTGKAIVLLCVLRVFAALRERSLSNVGVSIKASATAFGTWNRRVYSLLCAFSAFRNRMNDYY
jgi:hypothetical protein